LIDKRPHNLDTIDQLVVALERVRHVVRDALDEHVAGMSGDIALVTEQLLQMLPDATREEIAELVGVDRRTLARWAGRTGAPPRRLKIVARLVAILTHNWSQDGVVEWFHRPRRELGGKSPLAFLNQDKHD